MYYLLHYQRLLLLFCAGTCIHWLFPRYKLVQQTIKLLLCILLFNMKISNCFTILDFQKELFTALGQDCGSIYLRWEYLPLLQLTFVPVYLCSNLPLFQLTFVPVNLCSNLPLFQLTFVPVYLCSNLPVLDYLFHYCICCSTLIIYLYSHCFCESTTLASDPRFQCPFHRWLSSPRLLNVAVKRVMY